MKLLFLSDLRLPTRVNYPGHGLGRSIAKLAEGLVERGHSVDVSALPDSYIQGGRVLTGFDDELRRAEWLANQPLAQQYDVVVDGSHNFDFARLRPDLPIVCKCVDMESVAPYNRVYLYRWFAEQQGNFNDPVVWEHVSPDYGTLYTGKRSHSVVYVGLLRSPQQVVEFANHHPYDVLALHTATQLPKLPNLRQLGPMSPDESA